MSSHHFYMHFIYGNNVKSNGIGLVLLLLDLKLFIQLMRSIPYPSRMFIASNTQPLRQKGNKSHKCRTHHQDMSQENCINLHWPKIPHFAQS